MFSSSLSGAFVIGSTSWVSAGSVDALDSVANYTKTITHTVGTRRAQLHGTSKQTTINLSAAAYGVAVGVNEKKCTVDISQEERSETTQHTLTVTAPPHTYTTVYQLVLHCHIRAKDELLPFDIATRDVKIVSYGRGEQRTAPAVEETERAVSQWSGQVICDLCQQPVHVLRLDEGSVSTKGSGMQDTAIAVSCAECGWVSATLDINTGAVVVRPTRTSRTARTTTNTTQDRS